jgi:hypothetical protein
MSGKSIIQKLELAINANKTKKPADIHERVVHLVNESLVFAMEDIINKIVPDDIWLTIENLEFDLGVLDNQNFESQFKTKFLQLLEQKIADIIHSSQHDLKQEDESETLSAGNKRWKAIVYFLRSGTLPWWWDTSQKLFDPLECRNMMEVHNDEIIRELKSWQYQSHVVKRLINHFPTKLLDELIQLLLPGFNVPDFRLFIKKLKFSGIDRSLTERAVYNEFVHVLFKYVFSDRKFSYPELYEAVWQSLILWISGDSSQKYSVALNKIKSYIPELDQERKYKDNPAFIGLKKLVQGRKLNIDPARKEAHVNLPSKSPTTDPGKASKTREAEGSAIYIDKDNSKSPTNDPEKASKTREVEGSAIYIENAGLVLLHPYLKTFLNEFALVEDKKFRDRNASFTAILLLQYLVYGNKIHFQEYNLALNKILCGIPMREPVDTTLPEGLEYHHEVYGLLAAVIGHWKALKNTSINGLRETFLQRDGKLSDQGEFWLLQVEHKPYDILLEALPWGISIIKLPWMKKHLQVEW